MRKVISWKALIVLILSCVVFLGIWQVSFGRDKFQLVITKIEGYKNKSNPTLLIRHLDVNSRSHEFGSDTPIIWFVKRNDKKAVEILLNAGADPTIKNSYGIDALNQAYKQGDQDMIDLLNQHH